MDVTAKYELIGLMAYPIRIDWVDGLSHPPQFIARNAE